MAKGTDCYLSTSVVMVLFHVNVLAEEHVHLFDSKTKACVFNGGLPAFPTEMSETCLKKCGMGRENVQSRYFTVV